jgi:hypothetical protein
MQKNEETEKNYTNTPWLVRTCDLILGFALIPVFMLLRPVEVVGCFLKPYKTLVVMSGLNRYGQFAPAMKATLKLWLDQKDDATVGLEQLISEIELSARLPLDRITKSGLSWVYTALIQAHIQSGQIEDAAYTMAHGCQFLGVDRLPSIVDLDYRSAQIVKAAISAARMLKDGADSATLVVKPNQVDNVRKGATARPGKTFKKSKLTIKPEVKGQVIQFPRSMSPKSIPTKSPDDLET